MILYPHTTPIILTDSIFNAYGGDLDTTSTGQRQAAYLIAEKWVSEHLKTFLLPTIVTGSFPFINTTRFLLPNTYVQRLLVTRFINQEETVYYAVTGTTNSYVSLRRPEYGQVDLHTIFGSCNCSSVNASPYQVQFMYEAGLPTGTANQADMLLALTTVAKSVLNEIIGFGNEGAGDVGIKRFSNQQYSEERVGVVMTTFGASPQANFVARLLEPLRYKQYVGL